MFRRYWQNMKTITQNPGQAMITFGMNLHPGCSEPWDNLWRLGKQNEHDIEKDDVLTFSARELARFDGLGDGPGS
jgi:hypothetical protein